jgi:cyclomaltodextrin glucanotransferase
VYFVLTDRFVNGDKANDHRTQGGKVLHTFDRPTPGAPAGRSDNVGYLGGDFRGVLDNAQYIKDMGLRCGVDHADRRQTRTRASRAASR